VHHLRCWYAHSCVAQFGPLGDGCKGHYALTYYTRRRHGDFTPTHNRQGALHHRASAPSGARQNELELELLSNTIPYGTEASAAG